MSTIAEQHQLITGYLAEVPSPEGAVFKAKPGCRVMCYAAGLTREELKSIGYLAVVMAARKFEPSLSTTSVFKLYVFNWILSYILTEAKRRLKRDPAIKRFIREGHRQEDADRYLHESRSRNQSYGSPDGFWDLIRKHVPREDAVILIKLYRDDMTYKAVADEFGVSTKRIHQRRDRAIERLRTSQEFAASTAML